MQSQSRLKTPLSKPFNGQRTLAVASIQTKKLLVNCGRLTIWLLVVTPFFMISLRAVAQQTATDGKIRGPGPLPVRQSDPEPASPDQPSTTSEQPDEDPFSKPATKPQQGFHWKAALVQSLAMISIQRTGDIATEQDTRVNLQGPFIKDYFRSVANTHGWADGDDFNTNYVAHPFQGAVSGFIEVQNDPKGMTKKFEWTKAYWLSRLRAMGWAAAYSTYFEIGPGLSEATIGNVGLPAQYRPVGSKSRPPNGGMGFVDMVVTPTIGTGWLLAEDILDRYVIAKMEKRTHNTVLQITLRMALNPARTSANLAGMQKPWHRESRQQRAKVSLVDE